MKKNELQGLRELSPADLVKKELELREELFVLQMRRGTSQLENPKRLRLIRQDVARIQTIIREQKKGEAAASPSEG
ncbi:hypothetical protein FACS189460_5500 [Deltaproteobacteria bacterium]|nr:hypothetical protein FACS189460_5500 [Deltaproteobacteria bacterium]